MFIDRAKTFVKKLNISNVVMAYIMACTIIPIASVATSRFLTTYFYMAVVVIAVLFTFSVCRLSDMRSYAYLLIPFIVYEMFTMVAQGKSNILLAGYQVLLFLLPVCLGYTVITRRTTIGLYAMLTALFFTVTALTTIVGCSTDPNAARILATTQTSQDPTAIGYMWRNIGGYSFVYSAVLMYPCVLLAYKMKKLPLVFVLGFAAIAFVLAINTQYTFALMLLLVSSLLILVKKTVPLGKFIFITVLFIVGIFLFRELVALILQRVGELIGNPMMTEKMTALFLGQEAVDSLDDNRAELYMMSLNTFLNNPFFGTFAIGSWGSGGHSFILDNLALYGIIGGTLMAFMYRGIYTVFYRPLKDKPGYCMVFWIFLQPIILSTINTGMWLEVLCMFIPIILCWIYGADSYRIKKDSKPAIMPVKLLPREETET